MQHTHNDTPGTSPSHSSTTIASLAMAASADDWVPQCHGEAPLACDAERAVVQHGAPCGVDQPVARNPRRPEPGILTSVALATRMPSHMACGSAWTT